MSFFGRGYTATTMFFCRFSRFYYTTKWIGDDISPCQTLQTFVGQKNPHKLFFLGIN